MKDRKNFKIIIAAALVVSNLWLIMIYPFLFAEYTTDFDMYLYWATYFMMLLIPIVVGAAVKPKEASA